MAKLLSPDYERLTCPSPPALSAEFVQEIQGRFLMLPSSPLNMTLPSVLPVEPLL